MEPNFDSSDNLSWPEAMHSPEHKYWIAGAHKELCNLADLQVFVLIPCTDVPQGWHPLKGKLMCKCKCDDKGNVVHYKVCYVAKGYA